MLGRLSEQLGLNICLSCPHAKSHEPQTRSGLTTEMAELCAAIDEEREGRRLQLRRKRLSPQRRLAEKQPSIITRNDQQGLRCSVPVWFAAEDPPTGGSEE